MITLYKWDADGIYSESVQADEKSPVPARSTPTAPPETTGDEVAQWAGSGWAVLESRPVPPELVITASDIAARRWQAEVAGIDIGGMRIDTGRDSQALITGATVQAMLDPSYALRWKTPDGFVDLTAEQIIGVATAARAHVQACFNREAELLEALEAGTFTPEMLEEGWPNEPLPESAPS